MMPGAFEFSRFGQALARRSGIEELMEDLGHALASGGGRLCMLGGGNPAHIPEVERVWQERLAAILASPEQTRQVLAIYDPPRGNEQFLRAFAAMLNREFGWAVGEENLAVTGGGQMAFFFLFNLLAGSQRQGGAVRQIVFPVMPEYIGYAAQQAEPGMFRGLPPAIEENGPHAFRYRVNFDSLQLDDAAAAVCVSRPTNPSGNVLADEELRRLSALTRQRGIPLLIDNAYGLPFPGILFEPASLEWQPHHVMVFSLSKLGLPGTRTAVVLGPPEIARAVASLTAATGLANGNFGQAITLPLLEDGTLLRLAREVVRPFYERKLALARGILEAELPDGLPWKLHHTGGAMFLWLWLPGSPLDDRQWYERLKNAGVLVVPGRHFFFGLGEAHENWPHRRECLRISCARPDDELERGLRLLGREIRETWKA